MKLPYWLILKGAAMGAALLSVTTAGRWAMGGAQSLSSAGFLIVTTGLAFLPMFYLLLYPFLPKHEKPL
jgi:hypothetical protein